MTPEEQIAWIMRERAQVKHVNKLVGVKVKDIGHFVGGSTMNEAITIIEDTRRKRRDGFDGSTPPRESLATCETSDHLAFLTPGGLMITTQEAVEDEYDNDGEPVEPDADAISRYDETLTLSPVETLALADFLDQYRNVINWQIKELEGYLLPVARALLDLFADEAKNLQDEKVYWWPEIRYRMRNFELLLSNGEPTSEAHVTVKAWRDAARRDQEFPMRQQEELLDRLFKKLYFEKYGKKEEAKEG